MSAASPLPSALSRNASRQPRRVSRRACDIRSRAIPGGYILLEALTALGVFSIGILPAAWLAPGALQWWRQQGVVAQAVRIAAEAAELTALAGAAVPPLPTTLPLASLGDARGLPPPRWCVAVPGDASSSCPSGPRIVVVGPLPLPSVAARDKQAAVRQLRAVALWSRP